MRILLDEMYPRLLAIELQARGHDAISIHDTPLAGQPDELVLDWARHHDRVIVTENIRDYRPLAHELLETGDHHPGLILTIARRWPRHDPGALITALDELLTNHTHELADSPLRVWL